MRQNVADTSIAAYRAMPVKRLATQADRLCKIVELCWITYGNGMSLKEIQYCYATIYNPIELSTVSARVNALVSAKRLERLETTRKCSISGISIHPVRVPG